jgi:Predicted metal binding domain
VQVDNPQAGKTSTEAQRAADQARGSRLVGAHVTGAKFDEQLERWHANAKTYARRGWLLLSTGDLSVDIGFLQNVAMGGRAIPVMTACVRVDYWNFDLWPPSVTFLDPLTRQPAPPPVRAPERISAEEVRDALIDQHPETLQPFLCLPGIREYHSHPQHSGDDWLLHRHLREGDLAVVCERIWLRMARNVLGMSVAIQSLAPASGGSIANQLDINLLQGDADLVQRQLAEQQAAQEALAHAAAAAQQAEPASHRPGTRNGVSPSGANAAAVDAQSEAMAGAPVPSRSEFGSGPDSGK